MPVPDPPPAADDSLAAPRVVRPKREQQSERRWPRRLLIGVVVVALVGGAAVLFGGAWGLWSVSRLERVQVDLAEAAPTEPQNYLVVGSDSRENVSEDDPGAGGMLGKDAPPGQRADSLMVARIDPDGERIDLLSVPRDLWVHISGTDSEQRINTAYATSAQSVVDTVQESLGIPIHHFAEVDFTGFQGLIEALGGVPMYFDGPVRDANSGLNITTRGCHLLDGRQGLAFARSRHLEWNNGVRWVSDPTGDLGRMTRQQLLTRAAAERASHMGLSDVTKLKSLVDVGVGSVKLDDTLSNRELLGLGSVLSDFDPQHIQTHALPVVPHRTSGGAAVVLLDDAAAQPVLDIFRGTSTPTPVTTTTVPAPTADAITVDVINASGQEGEARRVSFVLTDGGFHEGSVEPSDTVESTTVIRYPPKSKAMAELVDAWLSSDSELVEDSELAVATVQVTLGSDFEHISEPSATVEETTTTTSPPPDPATGATVPPALVVDEPGWTPGVAPAGVSCN